jgi:hypothetical protein
MPCHRPSPAEVAQNTAKTTGRVACAAGRRYVAHVFYAFNRRGIEHTFLTGRYLNQELVDEGFAKPM